MIVEARTLALDAIRPYWRNPRVLTPEAVEAVASSIQAYGYQAPIIVDENNVVVAGHTRLAALRRLGWPEVEVLVCDLDPALAAEYRLIDNRTAEYSAWDEDMLVRELAAFTDDGVRARFFPQMEADTGGGALDLGTEPPPPPDRRAVRAREVVCPHCFHAFFLSQEVMEGAS